MGLVVSSISWKTTTCDYLYIEALSKLRRKYGISLYDDVLCVLPEKKLGYSYYTTSCNHCFKNRVKVRRAFIDEALATLKNLGLSNVMVSFGEASI